MIIYLHFIKPSERLWVIMLKGTNKSAVIRAQHRNNRTILLIWAHVSSGLSYMWENMLFCRKHDLISFKENVYYDAIVLISIKWI